MDTDRALLVVCITIFAVILLNVAIYVSVTRGKSNSTVGQIELLRRAARTARSPWEKENQDLQELSRRVADLKQEPKTPGEEMHG
jgi:hypothetical protein